MTDVKLDLSIEEILGIVNFLGYGRPSAAVWFIGFEEGLGKMTPQDMIGNLKARAGFESTMDLHDAHMRLQEEGEYIDIENKPPKTPVWQWMAKIMLAYNGNNEWKNLGSAKNYVRKCLGRYKGETFLAELCPIPKGKAADKTWMTLFKERDPEIDSKIKRRKEKLRRILKENAPALVVCYGSKRKNDFAELLDVEWQPVSPKVCASRDSQHLLLPFFGNGQMSHAVIEDLLHRGLLGK